MNDKSGLSRTLYDNKGNLIVSTSNNDKDIVRYEYDSNDRITKIIYPTNATVTYTYDENGNIKTVTDKDGLKTTYTYDENDNEVIRTTGLIETNKRYDADNRLIRIKNEHRFTGELIDEYSYRYDSNNNIIEEIKREPYCKKVSLLDIDVVPETNNNIRVTKQNFTYDDENKLTDARVERLGMKDLSEPNITTYHYEYDPNGNRTLVEIKDDGLTLESTIYTYDRLNKLVSSREVTASGLYIYEYTYDDNGNLTKEDRHRIYETNTNQWTNIRRYEYTKDNKLESVYSGNTLLVAYTYDGDGTITSSLDRDLDLNQNLNIHDHNYLNSLTNNQRQLINKVPSNDSFLYELTEYITDKNRPYSETLMERDGTGQLSTLYTYGNQRINSESYNNLTGLYTYDGRGSVSAVIGTWGDFRASYWYDGLGNVKSQIHGYGAFGSGKKYYGYNAEQYNPVTGNQNLRNRQVNIRRQRFLTEDTFLGTKDNTLTLNRYIYGNGNPLKYKDPSGNYSINDAISQLGKTIIDTLENPLFRTFAREFISPQIRSLSDSAIELIDKNIFHGGKEVADYVNNNSGLKSLAYKMSVYKDLIKTCTSNYGDETLEAIDLATDYIGGLFGFRTTTDSLGNKIVSTNYWCPQGWGGYAKTYDDLFELYVGAQHDKIEIGKEYTIWTWKSGSYWGLGLGGEVGIYKGTGDAVATTMSDKLGINITVQINGRNNEPLIDLRHDENSREWYTNDGTARIANQSEPQKMDWWDPVFLPTRMDYRNSANELSLTSTIDFNGSPEAQRMYDLLKNDPDNSYMKQKESKKVKGVIDFYPGYIVKYTWKGDGE